MYVIVLGDGSTYDNVEECFILDVPSDVLPEDIEEFLTTPKAKNMMYEVNVKRNSNSVVDNGDILFRK